MSVEEWRGDGSPLWDWASAPAPSCGRNVQFNPFQLQLPLGVEALRESSISEPPPSNWQLRRFLALIGVAEPTLVARELIHEFRSVSGLMAASMMRIRAVVGSRTAEAIQTARELMKAALLERAAAAPVVPRTAALIDFLTAEIGFLQQERLLSMFVNSEMRLMRIKTIADGDSGQVLLHARTIIGCGLAIGAAGYILVHNHPSGIPEPSDADVNATSQMQRLSAELGLQLFDHLIIARGRFASINDHWREARWRSGTRSGADAESKGFDQPVESQ